MPFLSGKIQITLYSDTSQTEFPQELVPQIEKEFSDSTIAEAQTTMVVLAASASQVINLNGVNDAVNVYLLSTSTDLSLTINGSATPLTWKAGVPGFMPMVVSSLTITNASSTDPTTVTVVLMTGA